MVLVSGVLVLAAVAMYLNQRYFKMHSTIGVMAVSMGFSILLLVCGLFIPAVGAVIKPAIGMIDFHHLVMGVMLGPLLFAGATQIDMHTLKRQKWAVLALATLGVLVSTALAGGALYGLAQLARWPVPLAVCLLFGALISPTDPIAVLSIVKQVGASRDLETKISCEALFNDGVGVVVFLVVLPFALAGGSGPGGHMPTALSAFTLFCREAGGGVVAGFGLGIATCWLLRRVHDFTTEVTVTLAVVIAGYTAAQGFGVSGPIAMVVAGIISGNGIDRLPLDRTAHHPLYDFWEMIEAVLVILLFCLVGLEMVMMNLSLPYVVAGAIAIPVVLAARLVPVWGVVRTLSRWQAFAPRTVAVLTWGGLRGGLSLALALAIPYEIPYRTLVITVTYVVVAFAILVQGATVKRLVGGAAHPL